jgi:uncharacterized RDD family membrane protein YckC
MRYWLILDQGPAPKPVGPFTPDQIAAMMDAREETPVCPEGGTAWLRLREVPELQRLLAARNEAQSPPPPPAGPEPEPAEPAGAEQDYSPSVWLRAGAYVIDTVVIMAMSLPTYALGSSRIFGLTFVFRLALPAAYFTALPVLMNGQTLGMKAAGIAIIRMDGSPIDYGHAFLRWVGYMISTATLFLGFLCALFTKRKRALHDFIADTYVVRVEQIGAMRKIAVVLPALAFPIGIIFMLFLAFVFRSMIFHH